MKPFFRNFFIFLFCPLLLGAASVKQCLSPKTRISSLNENILEILTSDEGASSLHASSSSVSQGMITQFHEYALEKMDCEALVSLIREYEETGRKFQHEVFLSFYNNPDSRGLGSDAYHNIRKYESLVIEKALEILDIRFDYWEKKAIRPKVFQGGIIVKGKRIGGSLIPIDWDIASSKGRTKAEFLKKNPNLIIENFPFNAEGGFRFGKIRVFNQKGYENQTGTVVIQDGEIFEIYDQSGKKIFPFSQENLVYAGAEIVDGKRKGGEFVSAFRTKKELTKSLGSLPGDFVVEKVFLSDQGGFKFLEEKLWDKKAGYENTFVTVLVGNRKVVAVYGESGEMLYPYSDDDMYVYFGCKISHGKRVGGTRIKENIKDNSQKAVILEKYSDLIIENFPLNSRGGFQWNGEKIERIPGYAYEKVTAVIEKGNVVYLYDKNGIRVFPVSTGKTVFVSYSLENGELKDGVPVESVDPEIDLEKLMVRFPDCVITGCRLGPRGGFHLGRKYFVGENEGLGKASCVIQVVQGEIHAIYHEDGRLLYSQPEMTAYTFSQNRFEEEEQERIGDISDKNSLSEFLKVFPDCIIENFPLNHNGGFFFDGTWLWKSDPKLSLSSVKVQFSQGKPESVFDRDGKLLYPSNIRQILFENLSTEEKRYKVGRVLPFEGDDPEEMKKTIDEHSRFIIKNFPLDERGGFDFFGQKLKGIPGYAGARVIAIVENGKIKELYNDKDRLIFSMDSSLVIYGENSTIENGKIVDGDILGVLTQTPKGKMEKALKKRPYYVIEGFSLDAMGGLNFPQRLWYAKKGMEYKKVLLVCEYDQVIAVYAETGEKLYSAEEDSSKVKIYTGGLIINGKRVGGVFQKEVHKKTVSSVHPEECIIEGFTLPKNGSFIFAGNTYWNSRTGLGNAVLTLVIRHNQLTEAYDEQGVQVYPVRNGIELYEVGPDYEFGDSLSPFPSMRVINENVFGKIVGNYANCVIKGLTTNEDGSFFLKGKPVLPQQKNGEKIEIAVWICNGNIAEIYDLENNLLYPAGEIELYPLEALREGKIFSSTSKIGLIKHKKSISAFLKETPNLVASEVPLASNGGLSIAGQLIWNSRPGYENDTVTVVFRDGIVSEVFDIDGKKLYPFTHENIIHLGAKISKGKITGGSVLIAVEHKRNISKIVEKNPNCILEKVVLDKNGGLLLFEEYIWSARKGYENAYVNVVIENGNVKEVYGESGKLLYARQSDRLEIFKKLWEEQDIEQMIHFLGVAETNRLLLRFYDEFSPNEVLKYTYLIFNEMSWERKAKIMSANRRKKTTHDFFENNRKISFFMQEKFFGEVNVLAEELIRIAYQYLVQDKFFLKRLKKEAQNRQNSHFLRKAYLRTYDYYSRLEQMEFRHLLTPLKFYQKAGVNFLLETKHAILADEPGLGKTLQTLAAAMNMHQGEGTQKALIISPDISKDNVWKEEIETHLRGEPEVLVVRNKKSIMTKKGKAKLKRAKFVIVNYEMIRGEEAESFRDLLKKESFDFIAIDEGHRIRNDSLTTGAVCEFDAEYKIIVSGTPLVGRKQTKLFHLLNWLSPERFPDKQAFINEFKGVNGKQRLKQALKGIMIRRYADDVWVDIPPSSVETITIPLTQAQLELYRILEKTFLESPSGYNVLNYIDKIKRVAVSSGLISPVTLTDINTKKVITLMPWEERVKIDGNDYEILQNRDGIIINRSVKERWSVSGVCHFGDVVKLGNFSYELNRVQNPHISNKFDTLADIVQNVVIQNKEKLVVFTGMLDVIPVLKEKFEKEGITVFSLHGDVSKKQRFDLIKRFNQSKEPIILISTYQTGGESINLQGAHYGVVLDQPWTYQERDQMIRRLHRLGQMNAVKVWFINSMNTIDDYIGSILHEGYLLQQLLFEDPEFDIDAQKEIFAKLETRKEDVYEKLKRIQSRTRKSFSEYTSLDLSLVKGELSVELNADGNILAILKNSKNAKIVLRNWKDLFQKGYDLDEASKNMLSDFFKERFEMERGKQIRVKEMILWKILEAVKENLQNIDYDGRLEILVEIGSYTLWRLLGDPDISIDQLTEALGGVSPKAIKDAVYYIDGANIFKLFSHLNLLPLKFYLDGKILNYPEKIDLLFDQEQLYFKDPWMIQQILPHSVFGKSGYRDFELTREEEIRIASQLEKGNLSAWEVLVETQWSQYIKMCKNVFKAVKRRMPKTGIDHEDIVSEGHEVFMSLVKKYARFGAYERISLTEYLKQKLISKLIGIGFRSAKEKTGHFSLDDSLSIDSETTYLDMLSIDQERDSMAATSEVLMNLYPLLKKFGFDQTSFVVINRNLIYGMDSEEIAQELGLPQAQVQTRIDRFNEVMLNLGEENVYDILSGKDDEFKAQRALKNLSNPLAFPVVEPSLRLQEEWGQKAEKVIPKEYTLIQKKVDGSKKTLIVEAKILEVGDEMPNGLFAWRFKNSEALAIAVRSLSDVKPEEVVFHEYFERHFYEALLQEYMDVYGTETVSAKVRLDIERKAHILAGYEQSFSFSLFFDPSVAEKLFRESGIQKTRRISLVTKLENLKIKRMLSNEISRLSLIDSNYFLYDNNDYTLFAYYDDHYSPLLYVPQKLLEKLSDQLPKWKTAVRLLKGQYAALIDIDRFKDFLAEYEIEAFMVDIINHDPGVSVGDLIVRLNEKIDSLGSKPVIFGRTNLGSLESKRRIVFKNFIRYFLASGPDLKLEMVNLISAKSA